MRAPHIQVFISFATSPGNVAEDGDSDAGNGLFTQFLIKELQKPAKIEDVFKRVRLQVRQKSQGRQIPWESTSLEDDFAFNDGAKHTFNPEDLIREAREAKEKEERLKAEAETAKKREIEFALQREQEKIRLAQEQKKREQEAEVQRLRDIEIAQQRELERQKLVEAQKIKEIQARQKAEAESRERERQLALAAEEQRRKTQEAEQARLKAEAEAKEREKQLALAAELEKKKAQEALQALERAKLAEVQRLKDIEQAKAQAELEAKLRKESADKQFEIQKADWDKIKDSKNVDDFYAFLNKYPSGYITEQAQFAVEQLQKAKVAALVNKEGIVQIPGAKRYRVGDFYKFKITNLDNNKSIEGNGAKIEKIENGLVFSSNGTVVTEDGALVRAKLGSDETFEYDPPFVLQPGGIFKVGDKWISRGITTYKTQYRFNVTRECRVVGVEEIEIPAGKFNTFKVEIYYPQTGGKNVFWYVPGIGPAVKFLRDEVIGNRRFHELRELVEFKQGEQINQK